MIKKKLGLSWQSADGAITKAPLGGGATGANPVDRGKKGTKRSILTEATGIPLGIAVAGANVHDSQLLEETFDAVPIDLPEPTDEQKQHLSLDKGYDYCFIRELVDAWAYTPHICSRGEEKKEKQENAEYKARRWVVERTHSWFNKFRRILVRWEKKTENYLAMLHLAAFFITYNAL